MPHGSTFSRAGGAGSFSFFRFERQQVATCITAGRGDWICAQITSNPFADPLAIAIGDADFQSGSLQRVSYARPGKLFTANESIFVRDMGCLMSARVLLVQQKVMDLFKAAVPSQATL